MEVEISLQTRKALEWVQTWKPHSVWWHKQKIKEHIIIVKKIDKTEEVWKH